MSLWETLTDPHSRASLEALFLDHDNLPPSRDPHVVPIDTLRKRLGGGFAMVTAWTAGETFDDLLKNAFSLETTHAEGKRRWREAQESSIGSAILACTARFEDQGARPITPMEKLEILQRLKLQKHDIRYHELWQILEYLTLKGTAERFAQRFKLHDARSLEEILARLSMAGVTPATSDVVDSLYVYLRSRQMGMGRGQMMKKWQQAASAWR